MKRIRQSVATIAASLVLAGGITTETVAPATASDQPPIAAQNFAAGSQAPEGTIITGPQGIAAAPPATTTVASNVNIPGLLRTGTTTLTAGAGTAFSKVTAVAARASWSQGPTTYALSISASQVTSVRLCLAREGRVWLRSPCALVANWECPPVPPGRPGC